MLARSILVALALALPLAAQPTPSPDAAVPAPAPATTSEDDLLALKQSARLHVARNGDEVLLTWELPELRIKGLDIYRNTADSTKGRGRLDFVKAKPSLFTDKVPDPKAVYFYWIKIVLASGETLNVGPVATPSGEVWAP